MADVWDEARWNRSARRWQVAVLVVVTGCAALLYLLLSGPEGPKVPRRIYESVAGPDVTILGAASGQRGDQQPEYLVVEVGGRGDPGEVLNATLSAHGWLLVGPAEASIGGSPSPGDGGYGLSWRPVSEAVTTATPWFGDCDRTDPRRLLLTIDNPPGWPAL